MSNSIYSQETLRLAKEAEDMCDSHEQCKLCKYVDELSCKTACLQDTYNIISKKTLQPLDLNDYEDNKNICILSPCPPYTQHPGMKCNRCLIEALLTDDDIMFIKKENK